MNVKELREAIEDARNLVEACEGREPKALKDFLQIFDGYDELSVDEFLDVLRGRTIAVEANPTSQVMPHSEVNLALVDSYVQQLKDAGVAEAKFNLVFDRLKKDTGVRKAEAFAISLGYAGGRSTWPTKADALASIEKWFRQQAYQAAKMVRVA